MSTEYPENAMSGLGIAAFTKHVTELSDGKLQIRPSFDAASGIRSVGMLAAIAAGRAQAVMLSAARLKPRTRSSPCRRCRFW